MPSFPFSLLGVSEDRIAPQDTTHVRSPSMDTSATITLDNPPTKSTNDVTPNNDVPATSQSGGSDVAQHAQRREGDVGRLTDVEAVPLEYVVRVVCSKFLLTGYPQVFIISRKSIVCRIRIEIQRWTEKSPIGEKPNGRKSHSGKPQ